MNYVCVYSVCFYEVCGCVWCVCVHDTKPMGFCHDRLNPKELMR